MLALKTNPCTKSSFYVFCNVNNDYGKMKFKLLLVCWILFVPKLLAGNYLFTEEVILDSLTNPWEIKQIDDDWVIFTQRNGLVNKFNLKTRELKTILDLRSEVEQIGESGLLGMEIYREKPNILYVYLVYTYDKYLDISNFSEKVVRFEFHDDTLINPKIIIDSIKAMGWHNGSRLLIGSDKKLYITTGDAYDKYLPQNISSINGKLLRLNLDGSFPEDNPFGNAVWSYGHRNAQGLVEVDGRLIISEHGPETDDEINIIQKGGNFGWPNVVGYCDDNYPGEKEFCQKNNVIEPVISLYPSGTLAVCGLEYYGECSDTLWSRTFLLATLKDETLYAFKFDENYTKVISFTPILSGKYRRLRCVRKLNDGRILIGTSNRDFFKQPDKLILLTPSFLLNVDSDGTDGIQITQTTEEIHITSSFPANNCKAMFYNLLGQKQFEIEFKGSVCIPNSKLPKPNIYILKIYTEKETQSKVILIQ